MEVLKVRNVNEAFYRGMLLMLNHARGAEGDPYQVRGQSVIAYPTPVSTVYLCPTERVLFLKARNANHFFHYLESLWILAGQRTVWPLKFFVKGIEQFSDDGRVFHGAYGDRLRHYGDKMVDQLKLAIDLLRKDPHTRRAVLQIWDPSLDLAKSSADIPCNDTIFLSVDPSGRRLNISVANRSNDMIWGCYGANAVQFSVIQEHLAAHLGLEVGTYTQVSNNYHVYTDNPTWKKFYDEELLPAYTEDHYVDEYNFVCPSAMFGGEEAVSLFDFEVKRLFDNGRGAFHLSHAYDHPAVLNAVLLIKSYRAAKEKRYDVALDLLEPVSFPDWKFACEQWIKLRRSG